MISNEIYNHQVENIALDMARDEFTGKVALITGAGRGAGRQVAVAFGALGAIVAANDINPLSLDETIELIYQAGGTGEPFVFDIAKRMPVEGLVAQVLERYDRIDCLINHASVAPAASLLDMDEWDFHRTLDVNLGGPFFTMQQVGRVMRQQGGGVMVNLISMKPTSLNQSDHSAYAASQAGIVGLTCAAAAELSSYHIRVNSIYQGPKITATAESGDWNPTQFDSWLGKYPALSDHPRLVQLVLFLCSESASALNGLVLPLDMLV
jgi:NAD(P)-dependent dehydrogenase (short-subunit alcohol dehydrogenase family)